MSSKLRGQSKKMPFSLLCTDWGNCESSSLMIQLIYIWKKRKTKEELLLLQQPSSFLTTHSCFSLVFTVPICPCTSLSSTKEVEYLKNSQNRLKVLPVAHRQDGWERLWVESDVCLSTIDGPCGRSLEGTMFCRFMLQIGRKKKLKLNSWGRYYFKSAVKCLVNSGGKKICCVRGLLQYLPNTETVFESHSITTCINFLPQFHFIYEAVN